jgi:hypothetical protein
MSNPEIKASVRRLTAALIAVSDRLDKPYTDRPELSPWTRYVQPRLAEVRYYVGLDSEVPDEGDPGSAAAQPADLLRTWTVPPELRKGDLAPDVLPHTRETASKAEAALAEIRELVHDVHGHGADSLEGEIDRLRAIISRIAAATFGGGLGG